MKKKKKPTPRRREKRSEPAAPEKESVQTTLSLHTLTGRSGIGIVDDHPMTRAGIAQLVNQQTDLFAAFEAASPRAALTAITAHNPDLLLADMTMEGRSGLEFIKDVRALHPRLPLLVLSMHDEQLYAERCLRSGAQGYVKKDAGGDVLLAAIRRVLAGEVSVSREVTTRLLRTLGGSGPAGSPTEQLTDREFQILELLGEGKNIAQIAAQMHISPKTADVHRRRIREKLKLPSLAALMRFAVRWLEAKTG